MKLTFRQIEGFVKAPDPAVRAILVYGPDDGLMRERARQMGRSIVADLNDPFNVSILKTDQILEDPARLQDEASALSMMGGKRLIRIEDARDALAPLLKDYLKVARENALIIMEAAELGPKSSLRQLCEKAENAAAVPCYVEDERDIGNLIRTRLQEAGYSAGTEAVSLLAAAIVGDRQRARSEIEKLITYMGTEKQITPAHVQACCGMAGAQSMDDLVYSVAGAKPEAAFRAYNHLIEEGLPVIAILRGLQGHFRKLHLARARMEAGEEADHIMKTLNPPIFFKQEAAFRGQLSRWSMPALEKILTRLVSLEAQCKQSHTPVETLCAQAILGISAQR